VDWYATLNFAFRLASVTRPSFSPAAFTRIRCSGEPLDDPNRPTTCDARLSIW